MKEFLFRGKRVNNGEWVYGDLVRIPNGDSFEYYIISDFDDMDGIYDVGKYAIKVIPETVSEFCGLTDKNGKKIFEGDIIRIYSSNWWCGYTNNQLEKEKCRVYYCEAVACFKFNDGKFENSFSNYLFKDSEKRYSLEVIGNIYDNPELIK